MLSLVSQLMKDGSKTVQLVQNGHLFCGEKDVQCDTLKDDFRNLEVLSENPDSTMPVRNFSAWLPFLFHLNLSFFHKYKNFTADDRYFRPRVFFLQPGYPLLNILNSQIWTIVMQCNALIFKCCLSKSHHCRDFLTSVLPCTKYWNHW